MIDAKKLKTFLYLKLPHKRITFVNYLEFSCILAQHKVIPVVIIVLIIHIANNHIFAQDNTAFFDIDEIASKISILLYSAVVSTEQHEWLFCDI